jgi:hypothetical protein
MKLEHFLFVVAILCVAILVFSLWPSSRPDKDINFKKYTSKLKNRIPDALCDISKEPICIDSSSSQTDAICIRNNKTGRSEWYCDTYKLISGTDNIYPGSFSEEVTVNNVSSFTEAQQECENLGEECGAYQYNLGGQWFKYSPEGEVNNSYVSGYRVLPLASNIFVRSDNKDLTNVFTGINTTNSDNRASNVAECEKICINKNCFGYTYDKDSKNCSTFQATRTSGTGKYLKNPNL